MHGLLASRPRSQAVRAVKKNEPGNEAVINYA